jgi:hypothetical protein
MSNRNSVINAGLAIGQLSNPSTKLQVTSAGAGDSGLRLTNLLDTTAAVAGGVIGVDSTGKVVRVNTTGSLTFGAPVASLANGIGTSGGNLVLGIADLTNPGIVTTGTQNLAGVKTLTLQIPISLTT